MISIGKTFRFESSHQLPKYAGKCSNLHGHSYKLMVLITGMLDKNTGMVADFSDLSDLVQGLVVEVLDHKHLNDILLNPTAENLVIWIAAILEPAIDPLKLVKLKLWETEKCFVEWRNPHVFRNL